MVAACWCRIAGKVSGNCGGKTSGLPVNKDKAASACPEVTALLADAERRAQLGARARARVAAHFTWPRLIHIALEAYARAMAARQPGAGSIGSTNPETL